MAHAPQELDLAGQRHLRFQAAGVFGLGAARLGDVGQHLDIAADLTVGAVHGLHRAPHPEGLTILAVVADLQALDGSALGQVLVDLGDDGGVGVRAAEQLFGQLAVALGQGEAGQPREGRVDPADAAVGVADQDGVGDAVGHQGQLLVGGLGALQGDLQLAHQLGLLVQGVLAGVQFFEEALVIVGHGLGDPHGQGTTGCVGVARGQDLGHGGLLVFLWAVNHPFDGVISRANHVREFRSA